jgi:hypothetical protein
MTYTRALASSLLAFAFTFQGDAASARSCGSSVVRSCYPLPLKFIEGWPPEDSQAASRTLTAPFSFVDPNGYVWKVPAGFKTDGASIPRVLQPITGGRWTRDYVRAAVVHDYYIRKWYKFPSAVHRVFYDALLASGTNQARAKQMYAAVDTFGPVWGNKLRTRWTDYTRRVWDAYLQQEDRIVAFNKRYSEMLKEGYRQVQERYRCEAKLKPHERMRLVQIRTQQDLAKVLGEVLKSTIDPVLQGQEKCVLGSDGILDCGVVDLRERTVP